MSGINRNFRRILTAAVLAALCAMAPSGDAQAQSGPNPAEATRGGKVPRFVSLRADEVNLRTGPGTQYPVEWVLQRRNMPVEVVLEFDTYRKIRDWQGAEGWVHQSMLSPRRYGIITGEIRSLRRQPEANSPVVARLEPGVVAQIIDCKDQWCRLDVNQFRGWIDRKEFWGSYPDEAVK